MQLCCHISSEMCNSHQCVAKLLRATSAQTVERDPTATENYIDSSSSTDSASSHPTEQGPSNLLMTLPPELRNHIYELAFTPEVTEEVYLFGDDSPSKALLLTCHDVYTEAKGLYEEAYRSFWITSDFVIDNAHEVPTSASDLKQLIHECDMPHISQLTIYDGEDGKMTFENGLWHEHDGGGASIELMIDSRGAKAEGMEEVLPALFGYEMAPKGDEGPSWWIYLTDGLGESDLTRFRACAERKKLSVAELLGAVEYCKAR